MNDPNSPNLFDEQSAAVAAAARRQIRAAIDEVFARELPNPGLDRAIAQLREAVVADAQVAIQITQAQLEGEVHNRMAIAAELQSANQKLLQAKAEADALRLQLQRAKSAPHAKPAAPPSADPVCAALERLGAALASLDRANNGARLLTAVFDLVAERFARVALCASSGQAFVVWRSRGFEPPIQAKTALRVPADSPLARAAEQWKVASTDAAESGSAIGLLGTPVGYAMALPVVAKNRGAAILYAENPPDAATPDDNRIAARITEILADYVRSRVHIRQKASNVEKGHSTQRRARRVRMVDGTTVVVDNSESTLIDLSSLGAQVLSPRAMRPNSPVHIVLPSDAGGVACLGRVVWVIVEQQADTQSALYRAGVQFTDVKPGELEGFLDFFDSGIRH